MCNLNSMGGHGWAWVVVDGYGLGMGINSKENVGLCYQHGALLELF
jgi:hypothetical protein